MKLSIVSLSLCLSILAAAQADFEPKYAVKDGATPALPKAKLPIPPNVNKLSKPPIKPSGKLPPSVASCKYSCPLRDTAGAPLVKKPSAFGWDFDGYFVDDVVGRVGKGKGQTKGKGWYDVFECVYTLPTSKVKEHTCSYYKNDGTHALGYYSDNCPPQAPTCPYPSSVPQAIPILGLTSEEKDGKESTTSSVPHFSSSQLDGAELLDPVKGTYKYRDTMETPAWVQEERAYVYVKEFPPVKLD